MSSSTQPIASTSAGPARPKQELYAAHIRTELIPTLGGLHQQLAKLDHDIGEYEDLGERIRALQAESTEVATNGERSHTRRREVLTELGGGVWVDSQIYDTSRITLDLGLNLHLEMPLGEAGEYVKRRVEILRKRRAGLKVKEDHTRWQIQQFQGAIAEASNPTAPPSTTTTSIAT